MSDEQDTKPLSPWILRIVSWSGAVASFVAYAVHKGTPYEAPSSVIDGTFLWISLGLLVLPFVRSLKIGKIMEIEREVAKAKETAREVRDEVRQSLSIIAASVTASASARATVSTVVAVQGAEEHPERSENKSQTSRSAGELKILNTLWRLQVTRYPDLMPRFTFRIDAPPADADAFTQAAQKLLFEGLIGQTAERQVLLTDTGLRYCKENFRSFPTDAYFDAPLLDPEQETKALAKVDALK